MIPTEVFNSVSLEFSALARNKSNNGERLYSLGLGEPFWSPPKRVIEQLGRLVSNKNFGYSSPFGSTQLRDLISNNISVASGFEATSENVLIAAGAKQALSIAMKTILDDNDEVIIMDPCFVSYGPQVLLSNHHCKAIFCPLGLDFSINFEALASCISERTKLILINTPNNPSGALISASEMKQLVELAKTYNIYLICDEIYRDFLYRGAKFVSANSYRETYEKIVTIDGFSKTYGMTGWRLGYLVASQDFISRAVKVVQHEMTNIPEFLQLAACEVFSLSSNWFETYRAIMERNAAYYAAATKDISFLNATNPEAGMFCFPKFELAGFSSDQIAVKLLHEQNVAVTPGMAFGSHWDNHLRISLSANEDDFRAAIDRFAKFLEKF